MGSRWVPAQPTSAALIRRDIADDLIGADIASDVVDDVLLVASELVSNAVQHANALPSGDLSVQWDRDAAGITVSVTDGGGAQQPHERSAGPRDARGRGLTIVSALADSWGIKHRPGMVTVWAHLRPLGLTRL